MSLERIFWILGCDGMAKVNGLFQDQQEYFEYLDDLRESGVTNMFGARPYLMEEFGLSKDEAAKVLTKWMDTFSERQPSRDRDDTPA